MTKTSPKKKASKKVAQKKTVAKKKVAKKVAKKKAAKKSSSRSKVTIQKNQTPPKQTPPEEQLSENAYTLSLKLGEKTFVIKKETVPEIVDALREEIESPMNIKTRGDIVVEQQDRKAVITMFVYPLKRLVFGAGDVHKIVFAKRVELALA